MPAQGAAPETPQRVRALRPVQPVRGGAVDVGTSGYMSRHWSNASDAAPDVAFNPATRKNVRVRARYEVTNNCYAKGILEAIVNDTIGTGPRPQILLPDMTDLCRMLEEDWLAWCEAVDFLSKYQTLKRAYFVDGEGLGVLVTNPGIRHEVKLDLRLAEADQLETPWARGDIDANVADGIRYDAHGNPVRYYIRDREPGALKQANLLASFSAYNARDVIHRFRADRPGQHRGLSWFTPALPLFAHLRAYTLSVIQSARSAANWSFILGTDVTQDAQAAGVEWEEIELEMGMGMVAPDGYKPYQLKAEQPTTTYAEFKREILGEIARAFCMPFNIAFGDSTESNYASARMDHQLYFQHVQILRANIEARVLMPLWRDFYAEAVRQPVEALGPEVYDVGWFWDSVGHVDPLKTATAQQ